MKSFSLLLAIVGILSASDVSAQALSKEVLVGTSSTEMTRSERSVSVSLQNLGPNAIFCSIGTPAVVNKSHRINAFDPALPPDSWVFDQPGVKVYCICSVLQVTGAATIMDEATK